ncbi:hypothetical protein FF38_07027 [Lucilia cuprina]|uniref:Uncharacterized protein n=1 Tax=Lucilia cuprina TaxID=7375 RepID=A0A0L0C9S5_LUCCU|nr:hypothetical protein FF38_07027 [Lucilia cuprina]
MARFILVPELLLLSAAGFLPCLLWAVSDLVSTSQLVRDCSAVVKSVVDDFAGENCSSSPAWYELLLGGWTAEGGEAPQEFLRRVIGGKPETWEKAASGITRLLPDMLNSPLAKVWFGVIADVSNFGWGEGLWYVRDWKQNAHEHPSGSENVIATLSSFFVGLERDRTVDHNLLTPEFKLQFFKMSSLSSASLVASGGKCGRTTNIRPAGSSMNGVR